MNSFTIKRSLFSLLTLLCLIQITSCSSPSTELEYSFNAELVGEGPFFEGSNTFQSTIEIPFEAIQAGLTADRVSKVSIKSLSLSTMADTLTFENINSISIQLSSANAPMTSVAVLNPLPNNTSSSVVVPVANEADVAAIVKDGKVFVIGDLGFNSDAETDKMQFKLEATLLFEVK